MHLQVAPIQAHILSVVAPIQVLAALRVIVHAIQVIEVCKLLCYLLIPLCLHISYIVSGTDNLRLVQLPERQGKG